MKNPEQWAQRLLKRFSSKFTKLAEASSQIESFSLHVPDNGWPNRHQSRVIKKLRTVIAKNAVPEAKKILKSYTGLSQALKKRKKQGHRILSNSELDILISYINELIPILEHYIQTLQSQARSLENKGIGFKDARKKEEDLVEDAEFLFESYSRKLEYPVAQEALHEMHSISGKSKTMGLFRRFAASLLLVVCLVHTSFAQGPSQQAQHTVAQAGYVFKDYKVNPGESLFAIFRQFGKGIEWRDYLSMTVKTNNLPADGSLQAGQVIKIPVKKMQNYFTYTVKKGDILDNLRKNYEGITLSNREFFREFQRLNGHDGSSLMPLQTIKIPLKPGAKPPVISKGRYFIDIEGKTPQKTGRKIREYLATEHPAVVMARLFMGELEGCNEESKRAVFDVIRYRIWSPSFKVGRNPYNDIMLADGQFDCFYFPETLAKIKDPENANLAEWRRNLALAEKLIRENPSPSIPVAHFYHDNSIEKPASFGLKVDEIKNGKRKGKVILYTNPNVKITENFSVKEFACKSGCSDIKIDFSLVQKLQKMRTDLGRSITITSGYRCPAYNKKVGGAGNSQHIHGTAADILINGITSAQMAEIAEKYGFGGIGTYPTKGHCHVDVRQGRARWTK